MVGELVYDAAWDGEQGTGYIYIAEDHSELSRRQEVDHDAQVILDYNADGELIGVEVLLSLRAAVATNKRKEQ